MLATGNVGSVLSDILSFSLLEQVFVANHTSMIDFIILEQMTAFAVIMQKHPGWVGKPLKVVYILLSVVHAVKQYFLTIGVYVYECINITALRLWFNFMSRTMSSFKYEPLSFFRGYLMNFLAVDVDGYLSYIQKLVS